MRDVCDASPITILGCGVVGASVTTAVWGQAEPTTSWDEAVSRIPPKNGAVAQCKIKSSATPLTQMRVVLLSETMKVSPYLPYACFSRLVEDALATTCGAHAKDTVEVSAAAVAVMDEVVEVQVVTLLQDANRLAIDRGEYIIGRERLELSREHGLQAAALSYWERTTHSMCPPHRQAWVRCVLMAAARYPAVRLRADVGILDGLRRTREAGTFTCGNRQSSQDVQPRLETF
eukprot:m.123533 g.123533  ORF g.123533 m.123533 type:complete len:232 (+) comp13464_c0_seq3:1811-2506(+)